VARDSPPGVPRGEYLTTVLQADAERRADFLSPLFPTSPTMATYAPEAPIPDLSVFGEAGWELLHMEPVQLGVNRDIMTHHGSNSST